MLSRFFLLTLINADFDPHFHKKNECKELKICKDGQVLLKTIQVDKMGYFKHHVTGCPSSGSEIIPGLSSGKTPEKCCLAREICYQTCGKTVAQCDKDYNDCQDKFCAKDSNPGMCAFSAGMAGGMAPAGVTDCEFFEQEQTKRCDCVDKDKVEDHIISALELFYSQDEKVLKEKLTEEGEDNRLHLSDDAKDKILEKWSKKPADLFYTLAMKYSKNANFVGKQEPIKDPKMEELLRKIQEDNKKEADERQQKREEAEEDPDEKMEL